MASTEYKINKIGTAAITRDKTLPIPGKHEIFRKTESATCQSVYTPALNTGLLTIYGIKKHNNKFTCKILGQQQLCWIHGILNYPAPILSCGSQIK